MDSSDDGLSSLVTITSHDDIRARPRYVQNLNANKVALAQVLAKYGFRDEIACGLSGCHQPHKHGYLVQAVDGSETNIGHQCGRSHFGDSFLIKANEYRQRDELRDQLAVIGNLLSRQGEVLQRIEGLRRAHHGADWCRDMRKRFMEEVGPEIAEELRKRARRNDPVITEERERSTAEIQRLVDGGSGVRRQDVRFEVTNIGRLQGLRFINSFPDAMLHEVRNKLVELNRLDFRNLPAQQRKDWVRWANGVDRQLAEVEDVLTEAVRFLSEENFDCLPYLARTQDGRERARASLKGWKSSLLRKSKKAA